MKKYPEGKPKSEKPRLAWYYLQVTPAEAHIFGADAALAFAYIRYTRQSFPNYQPSVRLLAANVPGLSNHRARFVMECIAQRLMFAPNELGKANERFGWIVTDMAAKGLNYKRNSKRGFPNGKGLTIYQKIAATILFVMRYTRENSSHIH